MDLTELFFSFKKILLTNKIPISILGMVIPFVLVSFVYQLRYKLLPATYKSMIMGSFSTIALVPVLIVYFQFTPALSEGICLVDRKRSVKIDTDSGKSIQVPLMYKITQVADKKYEMKSNDKSIIKMRYNLVDLDYRFRIRRGCSGID